MSTAIILVSIIGTLILSGLVVYFTFKFYDDKDKEDFTQVINLNTKRIPVQRGELVKVENSPTGRQILHIMKRDYSNKEISDGVKPEIYKLIVTPKKLMTFPKGTWSTNKNVIQILPEETSDIPEEIKSTKYGKLLMDMTEKINTEETEISMVREGSKRKTQLLHHIGDGELSIDRIKHLEEVQKDFISAIGQQKENKSFVQTFDHTQ